ncbi:Threonylcarbamoyl-AMP synthase [uncultured archaeon]|nr:Threonylcarbamoyl-AMP synthase [uncultured archaeon]
MRTEIIKIGRTGARIAKISKASKIIRAGGLVAFPTETVYGLGANALDAKAVRKIFMAKGRPFDDPLIVHISSESQVFELARKVTAHAKILMGKFWPGPLTIVLEKNKAVPKITTAGLDTVAIRMPENKTAFALIRASGCPIAAPSANLFGKPSPTNARHVLDDLEGKIDAVIDGGQTRIGVESTVIDLSGKSPVMIRPGGITLEQLEAAIGKVKMHPMSKKIAKNNAGNSKKVLAIAPGMKYRHYAPEAEVILVEGPSPKAKKEIREIMSKNRGKKIKVMHLGRRPGADAKMLYSRLRELDSGKVELAIVHCSSEKGIGLAVMNRLRKAATLMVKV